jgi:hypothetical protein
MRPGYVPGDRLLGLHPSLQFFFVLFVFFVDQAVAFDVFGGHMRCVFRKPYQQKLPHKRHHIVGPRRTE